MKRPTPFQVVRLAAVLALVALVSMVWSLVDPRPVPIMVMMSAGQALGTVSLLMFVGVVALEAYRTNRGGRARRVRAAEDASGVPAAAESAPGAGRSA